MESNDRKEICKYLKNKFNACSVEQISSNPEVYDVYIRSAIEQRDILVDREGNIISNMRYRFASTSAYTVNIIDRFDYDSSFVKRVLYIRGSNDKLGVSDNLGNVIIPPVFDIVKLYDYSATCDVALDRTSAYLADTLPFCHFYSIQSLYKTLAGYNKKQLRQVVEELDAKDELRIQKKIFRGPVFISSDCYAVVRGQEVSNEIWNDFKKNVDESMLLTKENFLRIIDTMDWDKYKSMIQTSE